MSEDMTVQGEAGWGLLAQIPLRDRVGIEDDAGSARPEAGYGDRTRPAD